MCGIGTDYCKHAPRADLIAALPFFFVVVVFFDNSQPTMKAATAAATTTEPSNGGGGGGKRKVETDLDDTMARICGRVTKRRRRLTLNERNNASDMILNDGRRTDVTTTSD